jgi:arabinan endo-1,5-alpha-L-arabinosidase
VQAIEAPYLVQRGRYYYLFVSFDLCCRGTASTYRIMVGRSESITGPYVDAEGIPMLGDGGGQTVVLGNTRWRGPGHNAVLSDGDQQYLVYHAYDAEDRGAATLRIADLVWGQDGFPLRVGP